MSAFVLFDLLRKEEMCLGLLEKTLFFCVEVWFWCPDHAATPRVHFLNAQIRVCPCAQLTKQALFYSPLWQYENQFPKRQSFTVSFMPLKIDQHNLCFLTIFQKLIYHIDACKMPSHQIPCQ